MKLLVVVIHGEVVDELVIEVVVGAVEMVLVICATPELVPLLGCP